MDNIRLGPKPPWTDQRWIEEGNRMAEEIIAAARGRLSMHYRNGREAKNGDKVIKLGAGGKIESFGVLHSAVPGNDYCNGNIAVVQSASDYACMVDCLHVEDVAELLKSAGLDKRPQGK